MLIRGSARSEFNIARRAPAAPFIPLVLRVSDDHTKGSLSCVLWWQGVHFYQRVTGSTVLTCDNGSRVAGRPRNYNSTF